MRFYVDLTKRRFLLKNMAIEKVKDNQKVKFAYADVNNNICLMLVDNKKLFFNSEYELDALLAKL